jgi:hypothetical protein
MPDDKLTRHNLAMRISTPLFFVIIILRCRIIETCGQFLINIKSFKESIYKRKKNRFINNFYLTVRTKKYWNINPYNNQRIRKFWFNNFSTTVYNHNAKKAPYMIHADNLMTPSNGQFMLSSAWIIEQRTDKRHQYN